jgi:hypothetical protein
LVDQIIALAHRTSATPQQVITSFLADCLKCVNDDRACPPNKPREHLVPMSVNVLRSLLKKPTSLIFEKGEVRLLRKIK